MKLHVSILDVAAADSGAHQYDVEGPAGLRGFALAETLRAAGHADLYARGTPLADVEELPAEGHLVLTPFPHPPAALGGPAPMILAAAEGPDAGQTFPIPRGTYSVGRGACAIRIMDPALSRHHADLVVDATSITIRCTEGNSAVDNGRIVPELRLSHGDRFVLGSTTFLMTAGGRKAMLRPEAWPLSKPTVERPSRGGRPWLMLVGAVLPLVVGIGLVAATGSWYFLAFSGLGLLTGGIPAIAELRSRRLYARRLRAAAAVYLSKLERAAPSPGDLALAAPPHSHGSPGDGAVMATLPVRLGRGDVRPDIVPGVVGDPDEVETVPDGSVIVELRPGDIGVIEGPSTASAGALRAVVAQLAVHAAHQDWGTWIQGPAPDLPSDLRRVPGVRMLHSPTQITRLRRERLTPAVVILVSPDAAWLDACSSDLGGAGTPAMVCMDDGSAAPVAHWSLSVAEKRVSEASGNRHVAADRMRIETLAAFAARLADASVGEPDSAGPSMGDVMLPSSVPFALPHHAWEKSSAEELCTVLGVGPRGEVDFDLVRDGPHMLIAGTTGSGKSELVKSLTFGLACRYAPKDLALMLIDFKGGATLGAFRHLPHCHAFVSDLHVETAERTLESLRTEIARRERLLGSVGAPDYRQYRGLDDRGAEPMPRLVVVVDEFRVLTDELPDALGELMRIAAVGRSLGIHLVLATQRPQGVVSAEMRANINAVVCLRLMSSFDSNDLLGSSAAAGIPNDLPGRAYLRCGGGDPVVFHAVSVGTQERGWTVTPVGATLGDYGPALHIDAPDRVPATPLETMRGIVDARGSGFAESPTPLFSDPLPEQLTRIPRRVLACCPDAAVPLGLLDDVRRQRHVPLAWQPSIHRRLAIVSGPAGGAVSALRSLVRGAARRHPECHIYLLDGASALTEATNVPRVAGHVGPDEPDRALELMGILEEPPPAGIADRILVVTGLAAWQTAMGAAVSGHFDDRLAALARDAAAKQLSLAVMGDRDLTSSRFFALAEYRLYCPFGLGQETTLGWPRLRRVRATPGRAVLLGPDIPPPGMALQLLDPDPSMPDGDLPSPAMAMSRSMPLPIRVSCPADPGTAGCCPAGTPREGLHGLTGPDNRPWAWAPGSVGLVLGRPGSGKTTALRQIASSAACKVALLGFANAGNPEGASAWVDDGSSGSGPPELVVVDDATDLSETDRRRVEEWHSRGARIVMAAGPSSRLYSALPLAALAREAGSALLLNPRSTADADFLGWRVRPLERDIPGRGFVMIDGSPRAVQCAMPTEALLPTDGGG